MSDLTYAAMIWDMLRTGTPEESPAHHDLDPFVASVLKRQCEIEHHRQRRSKPQDTSNVMRPKSSEMGPWSNNEML